LKYKNEVDINMSELKDAIILSDFDGTI